MYVTLLESNIPLFIVVIEKVKKKLVILKFLNNFNMISTDILILKKLLFLYNDVRHTWVRDPCVQILGDLALATILAI